MENFTAKNTKDKGKKHPLKMDKKMAAYVKALIWQSHPSNHSGDCQHTWQYIRECFTFFSQRFEVSSWLLQGLWSVGPSQFWCLQIRGYRWFIQRHCSRSVRLVILIIWMRSLLVYWPKYTYVHLREKNKSRHLCQKLAVHLKSQKKISPWRRYCTLCSSVQSCCPTKITWTWEKHYGQL